MKAVYSDRTVYTPFPDYELTVSGGTETIRTTYRLAGRIVAVKSRTTGNGALYDAYTDHLGSIVALGQLNTFQANSLARFDPFGNFRTTPASSVNPDMTDHGFTGHRHNNTGAYDLGLIYMNARYYLPEVGRFISPDTIVPEPESRRVTPPAPPRPAPPSPSSRPTARRR